MKKNQKQAKKKSCAKNCANNSNACKNIGFESKDHSFEYDENNEHSFELRDCK